MLQRKYLHYFLNRLYDKEISFTQLAIPKNKTNNFSVFLRVYWFY